jgi:succinate-semialdehyde dehydrogenase / glutarate-semialdehyde dehydrogenase
MAVVERSAISDVIDHHPRLEVKNPITNHVIRSVVIGSHEDVSAAVARARAAQPAWEARGVKARAELLRRWSDQLWEQRQPIIQQIREETGKSEGSAFIEIALIDNLVDYYVRHAPRLLRPQKRRAAFPIIQRAQVHYKAHGVAGFITPWNYPLMNAFIDLVPALIAGNTAVLKPSELTPLTALRVVEMMVEAGIPADVVQVVTGDGSTGATLVDVVDYVAFTGSTATGRKIAVRAAERLIPYSLELGGKDPLIVLQNADLELAASGTLRGKFENAGQACIGTERVYVEAAVYEAFVERLLHYVEQMTLSAERGFDVHVGSLTHERELKRTEAHIADAVAKGAKILYGGKRRPDLGPLFFEPTILVDVDHSMLVMQEETFGPVLPVMRVHDAEEAIRLANDSVYGLSAALFTQDLKRGEQIASRLDSGDVCINRPQMTFGTFSVPMGGRKQSGVGRRNGPEGLMRFVTPQAIVTDTTWFSKPTLTQADPLTISVIQGLRRFRALTTFLRM